ncbi:hypothetical protein JCM5350_007526 [Sporobolomyces pararoseus]
MSRRASISSVHSVGSNDSRYPSSEFSISEEDGQASPKPSLRSHHSMRGSPHHQYSRSPSISSLSGSPPTTPQHEIIPIALRLPQASALPPPTTLNQEVSNTLELIHLFCRSRGEKVDGWIAKVKDHLGETAGPPLDLDSTLDVLQRVLSRLERGEFLSFYNPSSLLIDTPNPAFPSSNVVIRGKGKAKGTRKGCIDPPKRILPLKFAALDLLLDKPIYNDALHAQNQVSLSPKVFNDSVVKISSAFAALWPHKNDEEEAVEWEMDLRDLYASDKDDYDVSFWRWFLIVAAERVSTREKVPDLHALLRGEVSVPQNVEPDNDCFVEPMHKILHHVESHSLGRIGLRQAHRIGFLGRQARDGGYEF